jgi:hypothetical protein
LGARILTKIIVGLQREIADILKEFEVKTTYILRIVKYAYLPDSFV